MKSDIIPSAATLSDSKAREATQHEKPDDLNDSAYGSQPSSSNPTPNTEKSQGENTGQFRRSSNNFPFSLRGLKKKKIPLLHVEISDLAREQFGAIQPHFENFLLEYIRANQKPSIKYKPISTRLIMMGTSDDDASPHIIVFCQPEQKSLLQRFAKQDIIKDLCDAKKPGLGSFPVVIIDKAPRLRWSSTAIVALSDASRAANPSTFCGLPVTLKHPSGQQKNATLGGIIQVTTRTGDIELYGITAGHTIEYLEEEIENASNQPEKNVSAGILGSDEATRQQSDTTPLAVKPDNGDDADSDIDVDWYSSNQVDDLKLQRNLRSWSFSNPAAVGALAYSPKASVQESNKSDKYYDWALFKMNRFTENILEYDKKRSISLSDRTPGRTGTRKICMICGSGYFKSGQLLPDAGSILIGLGEKFVQTYIVEIDMQPGICDGDSGSWVVDLLTGELYGHLIASDALNSGYVVPMKDVFNDIQRQLDVRDVGLPGIPDLPHATSTISHDIHIRDTGSALLTTESGTDDYPRHIEQTKTDTRYIQGHRLISEHNSNSPTSPRNFIDSGYASQVPSPPTPLQISYGDEFLIQRPQSQSQRSQSQSQPHKMPWLKRKFMDMARKFKMRKSQNPS